MKKVIDFTDRLEEKRLRRQVETHRHKSETVQRVVQCGSCQFRCAMCGHHMKETESSCIPVPSHSDCNLCQVCRAEYEDFLKMSKRKKGSGAFWHNEQWRNLWTAWLDYQEAMGEFRNSDEFRRLIGELED
ncbi:MAG: hypothetical protein HQ561_10500 [Desulfobacteraceae bacterium]|nr:hypothetical protein [Desulfobacteraceae bacterium]